MAEMVITNTGTSNGVGSGTSLTISHTVGVGYLQAVFFMFSFFGFPSGVSATFAGQAMTLVGAIAGMHIYRLVNPPIGTSNAVASATGGTQSRGVVVSYSGVHQTSPNGTAVTGSGTASNPSVAVSSAAGRVVIDFVTAQRTGNQAIGLSIGAGQTNIFTTAGTVSDSNDGAIGSSYEAGAGTNTMTWTLTTSDGTTNWAQVAVAINPAPETSFFSMF
jgi:hypothetical protein